MPKKIKDTEEQQKLPQNVVRMVNFTHKNISETMVWQNADMQKSSFNNTHLFPRKKEDTSFRQVWNRN